MSQPITPIIFAGLTAQMAAAMIAGQVHNYETGTDYTPDEAVTFAVGLVERLISQATTRHQEIAASQQKEIEKQQAKAKILTPGGLAIDPATLATINEKAGKKKSG